MSSYADHTRSENQSQRLLTTLETDNKLLWIVTVYGACIVALHLYGSLKPSAMLWGIDLFFFLPLLWKAFLMLLMIALLVPTVQGIILHSVSILIEKSKKISKTWRATAKIGFVIVPVFMFWIGREKVFLLGDGNLVIRLIRDIRSVSDIPPFFKNEPFAGYLIWRTHQIITSMHFSTDEEFTIHIISIVCGVIALFVLKKIAWDFGRETNERIFLFVSFVVLGTAQFFFGYVEVYPPLFLVFLLFLWKACSNLNGRAKIILPSLIYALLLTLHFGMICMFPALIYLWYRGVKERHTVEVVESIAATILIVVGILMLCGYSPATFWDTLSGRERHLLPLTGKIEYWSAYGFFSGAHFLDLANLHLLLFPFALVVDIVIAIKYTPPAPSASISRFLLLIAVCGTIFTLIINSEIGVSRDWDLFASFASGVALYTMFMLTQSVRTEIVRRRAFIIIIGITALHTAGWITVNAGEESAVLRFKELPDPRLWGTHAHLSAFEELAIYYRGKHDIQNALDCYDRYLRFDSTKGRIYAAIAHLDDLVGDKKSQMWYDKKAIQYGVSYPDIYFDLARLYVSENRMKEAQVVLKEGVDKNPESSLSHEYLGTFLMTYEGAYRDALPCFQNMIRIDSTNAGAYYNAGICEYRLKDYPQMKFFFDKFLRMNPNENIARQVGAILQSTGNQ